VIRDAVTPACLGSGLGGSITWRGIPWWPTPGAGAFDPSVPANVAASHAEGVRCLSANAPHGAVALPTSLATSSRTRARTRPRGAATHMREMGNAGAHPDIFGQVSADEARDLQSLVGQLIQVLYVVPAGIAKARAGRPSR
jgi:hypothetical protein